MGKLWRKIRFRNDFLKDDHFILLRYWKVLGSLLTGKFYLSNKNWKWKI